MEDKDKQLKNMEELIRIQQVENETERKALLDKFEKDKNNISVIMLTLMWSNCDNW